MNWYLEATDPQKLTNLRHEFSDYLQRHASEDADTDAAVLTFAELVNNAAEHAGGHMWVSVDWALDHPLVTVWDMGPAFTLDEADMPGPESKRGRGLAIAAALSEELNVAARAGGGARVEARLPIDRRVEDTLDPPRKTVGVLPALDEAGEVGFGKESFLRALVVQLAQELELNHGPLAAEQAVAQVGTNVGGQMEAEYRQAQNVVGKLSPAQMAECYVRLKHAIDGGFFVIEADENAIVLGNTRCPFGDAVMKSPALCRMTSSVFGGIAARNAGDSVVVLEERIAVGDPGCKVVVKLSTDDLPPHSHIYLAPIEDQENARQS